MLVITSCALKDEFGFLMQLHVYFHLRVESTSEITSWHSTGQWVSLIWIFLMRQEVPFIEGELVCLEAAARRSTFEFLIG